MDGLQKGPRLIDCCDDTDWFQKARSVLQNRMNSYQSKELRFTLLAVCGDQETKLKAERGTTTDNGRLSEIDELIQNEQEKKRKWTVENIRRRHNYFPFILNLIGELGKKKVLRRLTERAKEKKKEKIQRMEDEKKKREEADNKKKDAEKTKDDKTTK